MRVTAREEYGLRCLLRLARNAESRDPTTAREIAEGEGLSTAYAEKLLRALSQARLAVSVRGIRGGYRITRSPEQVTVGEVIRALGGALSLEAFCERFKGNADCCVHSNDCSLRSVWSAVSLQVHQFLDRIPLSTLLQPERKVIVHIDSLMSQLPGAEGESIPGLTGDTT